MSIENQRRSSINIAFKFLTVFNMLIFAGLLHAENLNVDSLRLLVGFDLHHPKVSSSSMKACLRLSDYYSKISKDSAKKYGLAAFHISSILKNDTGMAASFALIAKAYNTCGYFDSAAPYLDSSQAMFLKINEPRGLISLRNNRANMMMRTGDYVGAIENYQQNLIIADSMKDYINMIYAYNNMGIAYYDWKKYNYALKQYNSALEVLNTMGNEEITGPVFNNIGEVYYDKKVYDTALIYFNKALIVNVKYEKKRSILISLTSLGDVYYENKEYSIALRNYEKALKISKSVPDEINTAIITIKLGKVYNKLGNYKTAKSYFTEGLMLAKRHESANSILDAYSGLIDNAKGLDDADKVYQYGKKYIQLKDSLFNENSLNKISVLETKFKTAQKAKEILLLESKQREKDIEIQAQKNLKYALIIFLVVLLLGVVLLFNRYRLKKDKESAEVEKARLRLEQRLLHSQMNPHFIFNSLNSINSYIGNNNVKEAQEYLIKFAKLMRLILENSRRLMVSLADEINALKIYLELEKLRFDGLFEFDIDVDSEIENEYVYIPPLLIQPFVENAIIHGLKGRDAHKTKALIKLCFIKEKEIIKCVIEDNGVGRGQTIKGRNSASKHVSLGTQVTIERLAILRQEKNVNIEMDIIDLKDASGSAKGTKVVLKLPFEEE